MISKMKKVVLGVVAPVSALLFSSTSQAAADYTTLTAAVDFDSASEAVLLVAAALAGFYIVWKGIQFILGAIKRG